jgi:nitrate reductase gamma subunit
MSTTTATALLNWNEMSKIVLVALVGGTGVVIVFGLLLLCVSRGRCETRPLVRYGLFTVSGLCGMLVVAIAAVGVYAMTQKSSSAKPKTKIAAARR